METNYGLPLGLPPNASAHGAQLDDLTALVHWVMLVLFVGWGLFFLYTLVRFRQKRNPVASYAGAKSHFSTYGEAGVALVEVILLVAFAVPIWAKRVAALPPESQSVVVRVVAEQFAWNLHYPGADGKFGRTDPALISADSNPLGLDRNDPAAKDDIATINQLHLPVDKPVIIHLTSKDVIHSFSLPVMRVKQDAIPGMSIPIWFQPIKTGQWEIACAQLCGLSHYRMRGFLSIDSPADFQKWLADNAPKAATPPAVAAPAATPAAAAPATAGTVR
jgi:cytochrome c oxidase subunit II